MEGIKKLFADDDIIVCLKPVGLDSEQDMPKVLSNEFCGEIFTLHRLDKNVGGVMVYARNKKTAAYFSRLIADGKLTKEYTALLHGKVPDGGVLEDLLFKDSRKNKVFVVKRERKGVKKAKLEYKLLSYDEKENTSLVRIKLHTGRSHQIRVQFSSRGFPIVGDHKYGSRDEKKSPMLFSCALGFPYKGKKAYFEQLPEELFCGK